MTNNLNPSDAASGGGKSDLEREAYAYAEKEHQYYPPMATDKHALKRAYLAAAQKYTTEIEELKKENAEFIKRIEFMENGFVEIARVLHESKRPLEDIFIICQQSVKETNP